MRHTHATQNALEGTSHGQLPAMHVYPRRVLMWYMLTGAHREVDYHCWHFNVKGDDVLEVLDAAQGKWRHE